MNDIYIAINKKTDNKYADVRFAEARFTGDAATVKIVCAKHDCEKFRALMPELNALVAAECKFNCLVKTELLPSDPSAETLYACVSEYMKKFPYLATAADSMETDVARVKLKLHKAMYELAKKDSLPRLEEYLKNRFVEDIRLEIERVDFGDMRESETPTHINKNYALKSLANVIGNIDASSAMSAAGVDGNAENLVVCGIFTMATSFMSKSDGVKASRPYEKCVLYDGEHTLQCRYFPRDGGTLIHPELLNKPVCVVGTSEVARGRGGETSMLIRSLAECSADGLIPVPAPQPRDYKKIKPQPYEEYVQTSLFQTSVGELPKELKGSFTVFDFETTGLSIFYDKPTEIGAVKVVDGVITETFSTLIDPQRPIPPEVSEKTGITDDMVKGKPKISEVLADFYKFSYGSALVGHNISFDFPFLLKFGNRAGFTFGDRRTFDTMGMAPRAIHGIESVSLDSVLNKLGMVNDNAHRALSDALMTAKAFIAMTKIIYAEK